MKLRFTNYRRLDRARAADSPSASYVEAVRLTRGVAVPGEQHPPPALVRPEEIGATLREQFVGCARVFGAIDDGESLTFEELFTDRLACIDRTGGFADDFEAANIEWWDVEDESGGVAYELLFMGPGYGKLMVAGTTQFIGYVNQYDLYPQEEPNPHAALWPLLAAAQEDAKLRYPESELGELCVPLP